MTPPKLVPDTRYIDQYITINTYALKRLLPIVSQYFHDPNILKT